MKQLKKSIIIIFILILLIIISIIYMLINKEENESIITLYENEIDTSKVLSSKLELIKNKKEYINIKNCLNNFILVINQKGSQYYGYDKNNNYTMIANKEEINSSIFNILSENYKSKNSINIKNSLEFIYKIEKVSFYTPINIYKKSENKNVKTYAIYGVIEDMDYNPITESYLILNIDEINNTFSVEQLNNKDEMVNIPINNISSIEKNDNNSFNTVNIIDEDLIKNYILTYKRLALAYPEIVYNNFLDEEYKEKKFGTIEKFKSYINEKRDKIIGINIQKYTSVDQKGYLQYIAVDQYEKYYIFKVNEINDYKIILDNYTVDIPQFLEKYNKANTMERVGYNIQRCIDAINDQDYLYMYNKLDNTFKNNSYKTKELFIKDIKDNLFIKNKVGEVSSSHEGDFYIYKLSVENQDNINEKKNMTIIMKLKEETDFVLSFSFE